ncbi:MAG: hypothetical protein Q7U77_04900 [Sediminibacterium sp.]|uniref:hypothetical protein n=1 Tax=Sediminibacterium sp. TaxID=1917865 RepID=UPI0027232B23|nr:hypothetical protein [Sediminibacterium sp.]MDO8995943.1 hypothetical protein [Sediminibacterium sp.]
MSSKILLLAVLFFTYQAKAQNADMEKALADAIDIQVGGTFGKPRVSPKVEKLGIARLVLNSKQFLLQNSILVQRNKGY